MDAHFVAGTGAVKGERLEPAVRCIHVGDVGASGSSQELLICANFVAEVLMEVVIDEPWFEAADNASGKA